MVPRGWDGGGATNPLAFPGPSLAFAVRDKRWGHLPEKKLEGRIKWGAASAWGWGLVLFQPHLGPHLPCCSLTPTAPHLPAHQAPAPQPLALLLLLRPLLPRLR